MDTTYYYAQLHVVLSAYLVLAIVILSVCHDPVPIQAQVR